MSDPERLIDQSSDPVARRLLSVAFDEPPPRDLVAHVQQAVGAAGAVAAAGVAAKAAGATAAKTVSSGILASVAIGAFGGVLAVGGYELISSPRPPAPSVTIAPPTTSSAVQQTFDSPPASVPKSLPKVARGPTRKHAAFARVPSQSLTITAELELLDEVQRALDDGDVARARSLLDRYTREIPHGQLGPEAERLRAKINAVPDAGETIP